MAEIERINRFLGVLLEGGYMLEIVYTSYVFVEPIEIIFGHLVDVLWLIIHAISNFVCLVKV